METINLALAAIKANKLRSGLTMLGIVIGVTSVILLISLVSGLKTFITSQIAGLGSNLLFVIPGRIGGARSPGGVQANRLIFEDARDLKVRLADSAEVSAAIQRSATLKMGTKTNENTAVFGVEANYPEVISIKVSQGRFFRESENNSARRVAVVGKTVKANLFGGKEAIGQAVIVSGLKYTVVGVLESRGSFFGIDQDNGVYIPFTTGQRQFGIDRLNTIYISAKSADNVLSTQEKATKILLRRLSQDEFTIQTQEQALSTISQITNVLTLALGGIAAISLLVGGIGIMNIMLVSVTERTREIGLRKAVGANSSDIRNQFLIEAITLSGLGGIIGIAIGVLLASAIGIFFTTTIPWWSIVLAFGFSTVVGVIFGVAPAIRAARLDPIQALRYE